MLSCASFGTSLHKTKQATSLILNDFEHEGIFGRYYFDTYPSEVRGEVTEEESKELQAKKEESMKEIAKDFFTMRTNYARSRDPISNEMYQWLGLGLHSNTMEKKGLPNMDVRHITPGEGETKYVSKIAVAKESLLSMLKELKPDDSIAVVLFTTTCNVLVPLTQWKQGDAEKIKRSIMSITATGGTDLSAAFKGASKLLQDKIDSDKKANTTTNVQYRILFMTDMRPNTGETRETGLFGLANSCSQQQIYTTFVGIGEDFGSELAQHISTNLKGAQYMTVRTATEFAELMTENFEYSIFPTIFDFE
ncbi:von Willebrand factor type A [Reticulomyxa filosa]|uniref:von Willebrand factor type A n=1 Tax=Reticulomyxa filosa TaxID=46433 RepID=X6MHZ2_RETFI|nr:von Willebrand factor type A [Reticulomyxa filosa]|eukprot:ETO13047.1 von Willebrand factor type A [Reticulomyxa filosa]